MSLLDAVLTVSLFIYVFSLHLVRIKEKVRAGLFAASECLLVSETAPTCSVVSGPETGF